MQCKRFHTCNFLLDKSFLLSNATRGVRWIRMLVNLLTCYDDVTRDGWDCAEQRSSVVAGECCRLLRPQLTNVTAAAASALPSVCSTQSRPVCSQTHNNTPALLQWSWWWPQLSCDLTPCSALHICIYSACSVHLLAYLEIKVSA